MDNFARAAHGAEQLDAWEIADQPDAEQLAFAPHTPGPLPDVPAYLLEGFGPELPIDWPAPQPIGNELPPVLPLAAEMLPERIAAFAFDEAGRMPAPPDYVAAAVVVGLGAVIGARCAVKPKRHDDGWQVTPNLWGGCVGEPSAKKSPAISAALKHLDRLEAAEAEKHAAAQTVYEAELAAYEVCKKAVEAEMKKAVTAKSEPREKDDRLAAAKHDLATLLPPEAPRQRRFKASDATVEKIGDLLAANPAGLLVLRDELMGLLTSWERPGHESDRAFYLESWNGTGSFNIDRIGRGSLFVPTLCLSLFGGIQPDPLARYLAGIVHGQENDGLLQRFQLLVFPDPVAWDWRDRVPARDARAAMRDLFDYLAAFDPVQDGAQPANEFVKLPYFSFDDAALQLFIDWCRELYARIGQEPNPLMRQHLAKFEKLFCSLALIFHLADGQLGDIKQDTVLRVAAYCQYLETHARRIYGMAEAATVAAAQLLGRRLAEGKLDSGFTVREVLRKGWSGLTQPKQVEGTLAFLEEAAWIKSVQRQGETGRPTTVYFINPKVRAKKTGASHD